ncbi:accessory factor UbiK family protein [Nitrincola schmidtii]|uniref:accessory factor UbiK family protein n=1 Tax=Nitrincola schmidtii TaxID=1730894 RepID=UPI00124E3DBE|nr:accessory factor UbiK family protein [Nitrincola schmidtii]
MIHQKLAEGLSEQLAQFMNGAKELPGQQVIQQQMQAVLQQALSRLDLVTREEFDTQKAVLLRTREKLEALERKIDAMEAQQVSSESNDAV